MKKSLSGIYRGNVVHERIRPRHHRLRYSVFSLLLDLSELPDISRRYKMLAYNRSAFFSIRDQDHGDGKGIKAWVEKELSNAGFSETNYRIMMLCYPRILGFVFNPLTVFFCYRTDDSLCAIVYEVHNTFKERHGYVLPVKKISNSIIKQKCAKKLYVSPFVPMECTYRFFVQPPSEYVRIVIKEEDGNGFLLAAAFSGKFFPLSDLALLKSAMLYPLMTVKVIVGIHYEALKLFLKGIPNFAHSPKKMNSQSKFN